MTTVTKQPIDGARAPRADARRNREKVLAAARTRFAEQGLEAQMDEIARSAGVGVGTVYRHFPTKEHLLQALADARFEGLAGAAREGLSADDPWQGFADFMTFAARVMAEDRALSEAMGERPQMCSQAANRVDLLGLTGELVGRAQAAGRLRADLVPEDVPALVCGLGRAMHAGEGHPLMSWERHLDIILAGVRAS